MFFYDAGLAEEVITWVSLLVGSDMLSLACFDDQSVHEALKDGRVLCALASVIGGSHVKANESKMAFKQMENISKFLSWTEKYRASENRPFLS